MATYRFGHIAHEVKASLPEHRDQQFNPQPCRHIVLISKRLSQLLQFTQLNNEYHIWAPSCGVFVVQSYDLSG